MLCSKKWGDTLDYVSCFSLHFFRALAASCVLYNRTEHSRGLLNNVHMLNLLSKWAWNILLFFILISFCFCREKVKNFKEAKMLKIIAQVDWTALGELTNSG